MELALDTSTDHAGVALSDKGRVVADHTWRSKRNHTVELLPAMISLLRQCRVDISGIDAVIVARGPGSFNGMRVAVATAKGLAFSRNLAVAGVGTLEAAAFVHCDSGLPVCPILRAGRKAIATALFANDGGRWQRIVAEQITTVEEWVLQIEGHTLFCGEVDAVAEYLRQRIGEKAMIVEDESLSPRMRSLAALGWCRIEAGDIDDIRTLQPMYLKRPSITVPRERRHDAMSSMRAGIYRRE